MNFKFLLFRIFCKCNLLKGLIYIYIYIYIAQAESGLTIPRPIKKEPGKNPGSIGFGKMSD
jgi:hypothetical protein